MKIKNNYQQTTFGHTYIDIKSLNSVYKASPIIQALKEQNTPLRKFIKEIINTKHFEDNIGDCFIKLSGKVYRTEHAFKETDIIQFLFPKKQEQARKIMFHELENMKTGLKNKLLVKELIPDLAAKKGSFSVEFEDGSPTFCYDISPTHEKLVNYIKSNEIVEDLKKRIQYFKNNF